MRYDPAPAGEYIREIPGDVLQMLAIQGEKPTRLVRCRECAHARKVDGKLACSYRTQWWHSVEMDGYCDRGELPDSSPSWTAHPDHKLRALALGMWRTLDALRLAGKVDNSVVDGYAERLKGCGIPAQ